MENEDMKTGASVMEQLVVQVPGVRRLVCTDQHTHPKSNPKLVRTGSSGHDGFPNRSLEFCLLPSVPLQLSFLLPGLLLF